MLYHISFLVAGVIIITSAILGAKTNILKANSSNLDAPYSFSKVQLMWWTVIVSCCFIILYGRIGDFNLLNHSTLILLSIGMATTASSSLIDVGQKDKKMARHQDGTSIGFFRDIMSDGTGISMHRFQGVLFNVLFGITFVVTFWTKKDFPDYNAAELSLMGASSAAYLALKTNENK